MNQRSLVERLRQDSHALSLALARLRPSQTTREVDLKEAAAKCIRAMEEAAGEIIRLSRHAPGMTDLMATPEVLTAFVEENPPVVDFVLADETAVDRIRKGEDEDHG